MRPVAREVTVVEEYFRREGVRLRIEAAFVFGSRAGEVARADSDVDVAVVFSEEGAAESMFDRSNEVAQNLCRLLGADVDVVVLDRDFSRPMLAYNVIVQGIPVYVRDANNFLALRNEAMRQKEDFSRFGIGWQLEVARTKLERLGHA